jgi:TetR/AcrR family transcriptional regulator, transcriptional repressor for nem operon
MFVEISAHMRAAAVESAADGEYGFPIVNAYLSEDHREHPTRGCPVAALTSEIARQPQPVRQEYTRGFKGPIRTMAKYLPGRDEEERSRPSGLLLAGMAGSMMVARAVSDRDLSNRILAQTQEFYISAFERVPAQERVNCFATIDDGHNLKAGDHVH